MNHVHPALPLCLPMITSDRVPCGHHCRAVRPPHDIRSPSARHAPCGAPRSQVSSQAHGPGGGGGESAKSSTSTKSRGLRGPHLVPPQLAALRRQVNGQRKARSQSKSVNRNWTRSRCDHMYFITRFITSDDTHEDTHTHIHIHLRSLKKRLTQTYKERRTKQKKARVLRSLDVALLHLKFLNHYQAIHPIWATKNILLFAKSALPRAQSANRMALLESIHMYQPAICLIYTVEVFRFCHACALLIVASSDFLFSFQYSPGHKFIRAMAEDLLSTALSVVGFERRCFWKRSLANKANETMCHFKMPATWGLCNLQYF